LDTAGVKVTTSVVLIVGLISIWFDDPTRLTAAVGMVTAGLAFALQKVVTSLAGYVVILRGKTFSVGDRIVMGGVRGDVIALRFTQTVIMEMGQPPGEQSDAPSMWVRARQYTGRMVSVSNSQIFDFPVYNYSREFPFLWEETTLTIDFAADVAVAEQIMLKAAERHTVAIQQISEEALTDMERRYFMTREELKPQVYCRIANDGLEMTLRFIVEVYKGRRVVDKLSRDVVREFRDAGIAIATATTSVELAGEPKLRVRLSSPSA
jgi:small-conductance mechanosensitive channel